MMDAASVYQAREWLQKLSAACSTCNPAEELLSPLRNSALTVRNRPEALRSSRGLQQAQSLLLRLQVVIVNQARTFAAQARQQASQYPITSCLQHRDEQVPCRLSSPMVTSVQQQVWSVPAAACICTTGQARQACKTALIQLGGNICEHAAEHSAACSSVRWLPLWQPAQQTSPGG